MTKYILNSGGVRRFPEKAKKFYGEVFKDAKSQPKVLLCFFARKREEWEGKFEEYSENMRGFIPSEIDPIFKMAMPDLFEVQVADADIIIIYGGDDYLVQYWMSKFDLPKMLEGKVVAGSSAGSDVFVKHFWTCDWRECLDGLGVVPIKFIPHFKSDYGSEDPRGSIDWDKAYKELESCGDKDLPIHALEEGEFVVFEQ